MKKPNPGPRTNIHKMISQVTKTGDIDKILQIDKEKRILLRIALMGGSGYGDKMHPKQEDREETGVKNIFREKEIEPVCDELGIQEITYLEMDDSMMNYNESTPEEKVDPKFVAQTREDRLKNTNFEIPKGTTKSIHVVFDGSEQATVEIDIETGDCDLKINNPESENQYRQIEPKEINWYQKVVEFKKQLGIPQGKTNRIRIGLNNDEKNRITL